MKHSLYILLIFVILLHLSCGVLLDDAKYRGEWNLNKSFFYQYNSIFNSLLSIEGLEYTTDASADTVAPFVSQYFDVISTSVKMYIESNFTFSIQDSSANVICTGRWSIDTYNNTVTWTLDGTGTNRFWSKKNKKITNAWVMSSNNKFNFYVKASDFGLDSFEFELSEKPVPDKIEKNRFETNIINKLDTNISSHRAAYDSFTKYYKLNTADSYYYLQNNITPDKKSELYQYLNSEGLKFEYETVIHKFDAMEAQFLRNGYTE